MPDHVVAVDGGNSKTDVVIASTAGRVLARVRGPGVLSPLVDPAGWRDGLVSLVEAARRAAGLRTRAVSAAYFLANVDLAVQRAGASRDWGVAVVSGAGINAVGVHPSGRTAGFLALGACTGDSGGGIGLGLAALGAAVRARDGRGPATLLATAVPAAFGLRRPSEVAVAVHTGAIRYDELHVLAPVLFATAADGDPVPPDWSTRSPTRSRSWPSRSSGGCGWPAPMSRWCSAAASCRPVAACRTTGSPPG